jgi:DNA-directed RNA polymerase subunit RPC12/RpoP
MRERQLSTQLLLTADAMKVLWRECGELIARLVDPDACPRCGRRADWMSVDEGSSYEERAYSCQWCGMRLFLWPDPDPHGM